MRRALLGVGLLLAGCASEPPLPPPVPITPPKPVVHPVDLSKVCGIIDPTWTNPQWMELAVDLGNMPANSVIVKMALEWKRLRDEAVACHNAQHPPTGSH